MAGNAPTLDVFALRDSVVDEYKRFAASFTTIHAQDIREQVEAIYAEQRYWPEPLIQINPSYKMQAEACRWRIGGGGACSEPQRSANTSAIKNMW